MVVKKEGNRKQQSNATLKSLVLGLGVKLRILRGVILRLKLRGGRS